MPHLLVTGSSGLIGSEVVEHFHKLGWEVHGIDNNQRAAFFGPLKDTRLNRRRLEASLVRFRHYDLDIRNRAAILDLVKSLRPFAAVHAAAQPSHDLAAKIPFDDFEINAVGTLNLLEAARRYAAEAPFLYLSINKVYGDAPNDIPLVELKTRFDYAAPHFPNGIPETFPIDHTTHSLFGASKLAADILVQEYGRYFDMPTCCLRGGCLTGAKHAGVELHEFLSWLVKCSVRGQRYTVFGHKGKQVRDNIHSADVARFVEHFALSPRRAAVYNIGGTKANRISILEAFAEVAKRTGRSMIWDYVDKPRAGDHICYYSDMSTLLNDYPKFTLTWSLASILDDLVDAELRRLASAE